MDVGKHCETFLFIYLLIQFANILRKYIFVSKTECKYISVTSGETAHLTSIFNTEHWHCVLYIHAI